MNKFSIAFIDMLYCFLTITLVVLALFAAKFVEDPTKAKGTLVNPSDFLIEMAWEDYSKTDMDLWVSNPNGFIAYYGEKDIGGMTLDRDDMGMRGAEHVRLEVTSVREIIPGRYRVGAVKYSDQGNEMNKVTITVRKLNPYLEVSRQTIEFPPSMDKIHRAYVEFTIDAEGNVNMINTNPEFDLRDEMVLRG